MMPPSASVLDSRASECNLLLAPGPGALIMSVNGATMAAFWESEVLWWVLLMILSPSLQKSTHYSLKASMSASLATTKAFRESEVLWLVLLRILSQKIRAQGVAGGYRSTITILTP